MIRRPPRSTQSRSSAASDVYKRQRLLRVQRVRAFSAVCPFLFLLQFPVGIQDAHPGTRHGVRLRRVPWPPEKERNAEYGNHWNDDEQELLCLLAHMYVSLYWFHSSPLLM